MKKCNTCNVEKNECDFYKGHAKCKACYIEKVKANREEKADYYREYDRQRDQLPHRIEMKKKYSQTEAGKIAGQKAKEKWTKENVIKRSANIILHNAIRDGKIIKPSSCEECSATDVRIHGHHDNYAYPMAVRWLCSKCHTAWHKINGSGMNG